MLFSTHMTQALNRERQRRTKVLHRKVERLAGDRSNAAPAPASPAIPVMLAR